MLTNAQFIVAAHSPILMAYSDAWIYACTADGLRRVTYQETEHFQVTRDFLANAECMLTVLLAR